jgi:excisionase family DNA binding protein
MSVVVTDQRHRVPVAAKILGLSEKCVWRWIELRKIGIIRVGRLVFIPESEIVRILERGYQPAKSA